jgi:hypothetical protein
MTRLIYSAQFWREYLRHKPIAEAKYYLLWDFNSDIVKIESTPTATRSVITKIHLHQGVQKIIPKRIYT